MPTLCGLHGLFGGPEHWADLAARLAPGRRVVAPALPLTAETVRDGIPGLSRFVAGWLTAQGLERVVLLGNSFGGHVALDFALRYPTRVAALVLTGSAGLLERSFTRGVTPSPSPDFIRARAEEVFYDPAFVTDDLVLSLHRFLGDRRNVRAVVGWARATRDYPMGEHLAAIGAPALLVWGEADRITPLAAAEAFRRGLPDARLVSIPRCGHAPMLETPGAFARAVTDFLGTLAPRGAAAATALA